MSIQDKLQKATANLKRKLTDININIIGNSEYNLAFTIEEDYRGNDEYNITNDRIVTAFIDFPANEIPITNSESNTGTKGVHLYDILPIEAYFKFEDNIKLGEWIIKKLEMPDNTFRVCILKVVDNISRFSSVSMEWQKFILAPVNITTDLYQDVFALVNAYRDSEDWIPDYDRTTGEWDG